jgi:hypothetical protein
MGTNFQGEITRIKNCLKQAGLRMEIARGMTDGQLLRVPGLSYKSVRKILGIPDPSPPAPLKTEFTPEDVFAARQAAGMTQAEAASLVHLSRWQTWSEYENGQRPADPARLQLFLILTRQAKIPRKIPQRSTTGRDDRGAINGS